MDQIQVTATLPSIAPENLAAFKALAAEVLTVVAEEAGTLQHDWFLNDDETVCVVHETYADSDVVLAHLGHLGELLGRLIPLGGGFSIDLFGTPSAELTAAMEALHPTVYRYFQGKQR